MNKNTYVQKLSERFPFIREDLSVLTEDDAKDIYENNWPEEDILEFLSMNESLINSKTK